MIKGRISIILTRILFYRNTNRFDESKKAMEASSFEIYIPINSPLNFGYRAFRLASSSSLKSNYDSKQLETKLPIPYSIVTRVDYPILFLSNGKRMMNQGSVTRKRTVNRFTSTIAARFASFKPY